VQRRFQIKKNIAFASSHQRHDGPENVVKPSVSERYYDKRYKPARNHKITTFLTLSRPFFRVFIDYLNLSHDEQIGFLFPKLEG